MNYEINDPWARASLASWDGILTVYSAVLNTDNFDALTMELVKYVVIPYNLFSSIDQGSYNTTIILKQLGS